MKAFDWSNPYPSVRIPLFARNVVSTSHPLAAQAGLRMLLRVATPWTRPSPPRPPSCWSSRFPAAWAATVSPSSGTASSCMPEFLRRGPGRLERRILQAQARRWRTGWRCSKRGWDSVTVPGVVAGWAALHEKLGKLPFEQLFEPAIEIAERGYAVPPVVAHKWPPPPMS